MKDRENSGCNEVQVDRQDISKKSLLLDLKRLSVCLKKK